MKNFAALIGNTMLQRGSIMKSYCALTIDHSLLSDADRKNYKAKFIPEKTFPDSTAASITLLANSCP